MALEPYHRVEAGQGGYDRQQRVERRRDAQRAASHVWRRRIPSRSATSGSALAWSRFNPDYRNLRRRQRARGTVLCCPDVEEFVVADQAAPGYAG